MQSTVMFPYSGSFPAAIVKNYGISATRIACQTENLTTKEPDLSFVNRVDSMDSDADVVVVFGGTNDFGHGDAKLGTFEPRSLHLLRLQCTFCVKSSSTAFQMQTSCS